MSLFLVKLTSSFLTIHYNATHACTIIHYNAGAGYKEVTLKNHGTMDLQFCMESFFLGSTSKLKILQIIMWNIGMA